MANQMPSSNDFNGLTRSVIAYAEAFTRLVDKAKAGPLTNVDWEEIEQIVDVSSFVREGVFLGPKAEVIDWPTYRSVVTQYGAMTLWEGTLRHVTETPGRVILELEERNTRDGVIDISYTVTIYEFNAADKLTHLDVYVMPRSERPVKS